MLSTSFDEIVQRRRSNRKYDPDVKVPAEVIKRSLERAILSPNSSNMQLWEFYWIKSEEMKKKFVDLCLGQSAAATAQDMVVFVTRQDHWRKRVKWHLDLIKAEIEGEPTKVQKMKMNYYGKLMPLAYGSDPLGLIGIFRWLLCSIIGLFKPMARIRFKSDQRTVVHKSCALAAQTFMLAIASEDFDSCPMEGFDAVRVKKALGLPRGAEINMIISVGKGTERGIWGPRFRVPYEEVVFEK